MRRVAGIEHDALRAWHQRLHGLLDGLHDREVAHAFDIKARKRAEALLRPAGLQGAARFGLRGQIACAPSSATS
jgi:hypothetical protein